MNRNAQHIVGGMGHNLGYHHGAMGEARKHFAAGNDGEFFSFNPHRAPNPTDLRHMRHHTRGAVYIHDKNRHWMLGGLPTRQWQYQVAPGGGLHHTAHIQRHNTHRWTPSRHGVRQLPGQAPAPPPPAPVPPPNGLRNPVTPTTSNPLTSTSPVNPIHGGNTVPNPIRNTTTGGTGIRGTNPYSRFR